MEKKLRELMSELFNMRVDEITDSLTMKELDVWDSLKHMELITSIEQEMEIELTTDEIIAMNTFEDIKRIICEKKGDIHNGVKR
jgi:acyl carrier protein